MTGLWRAKPFKDVTVGAILLALMVVVFATIGILYARTIPHRSRAEAFLREFVQLTPGQSTFEQAQHVAREYGGIPWYVDNCGNMTCTFQKCVLAFQFDNMPLSYVPRVGYTRLFAAITVKNGTVVGSDVAYEGSAFGYEVFYTGQLPRGWQYGVNRLKVDAHGTPHVLQVVLGPSSSQQLKRRAYSIDLSCLAKLWRCGGPSAVYPSGLDYLRPPFSAIPRRSVKSDTGIASAIAAYPAGDGWR